MFDWTKCYPSANAIELDLRGFKFTGLGWYITGTDATLVSILTVAGEFFSDKAYYDDPSGFIDLKLVAAKSNLKIQNQFCVRVIDGKWEESTLARIIQQTFSCTPRNKEPDHE